MRSHCWVIAIIVALLALFAVGNVDAQTVNVPVIRDFIQQPYVPVLTTAPSNVVTTATCALTITDNVVAGNTITISGPTYPAEVYEFYTTTYTGTNTGVERHGSVTATSYGNLVTAINDNSNFIRATLTGDTTLTLAARLPFSGHSGNGIKVEEVLTNAVAVRLSATKFMNTGVSVMAGPKGALCIENSDGVYYLWFKTAAGRKTAGLWIRAAGYNTETTGAITSSEAITGADLVATDDLQIGDDSVFIDDVVVHGDATLNGDVTTTKTVTAADVTTTDDLLVGDDARVNGDALVVGGATVHGPLTLHGDTTTTGAMTRANQKYTYSVSKLGASGAGWTVNDAASTFTSKLPASQTAETLVIPITGLKAGSIITGFNLVGRIEGSASGTFTLDAALRKHTAAAGAIADALVTDGAITQISLVDAAQVDTILSSSNAGKTGINETVGVDETFYVLITGTTVASNEVDLQGVVLTVTEK